MDSKHNSAASPHYAHAVKPKTRSNFPAIPWPHPRGPWWFK